MNRRSFLRCLAALPAVPLIEAVPQAPVFAYFNPTIWFPIRDGWEGIACSENISFLPGSGFVKHGGDWVFVKRTVLDEHV